MKYDGKFASRWRAKSPDALCAVLPYRKEKAVRIQCEAGTGQLFCLLFRNVLVRFNCVCRTFRSAGTAGNASILCNLVLICTLRDCVYRTCILTCTAANASIRNLICHGNSPPCLFPQESYPAVFIIADATQKSKRFFQTIFPMEKKRSRGAVIPEYAPAPVRRWRKYARPPGNRKWSFPPGG